MSTFWYDMHGLGIEKYFYKYMYMVQHEANKYTSVKEGTENAHNP